MKKLIPFLIFCLAGFAAQSQFIYKIKADSVLITNDSCTAELNLENSTKNVNGFLFNKGRGRTEFRKGLIKFGDSLFTLGVDTVNLNTTGSWKLTGNTGTNPGTNFLGTTDGTSLTIRTNNITRMTFHPTDMRIGINKTEPTEMLHLYGNNPRIYLEGDSVSYGPAVTFKSAGNRLASLSPYGVESSYAGGLHLVTSTAHGYSQVGAYYTGAKTTSTDSTVITHQVVGAPHQMADIFDVSENLYPSPGNVIPNSFLRVKNTGILALSKYKNNVGEDSVLSTDVDGNVKLRSLLSGISSNAWGLTGNAGTSSSTNFIGTTDDNMLVFKTNNIERMRIRNTGDPQYAGFVGIGTNTPTRLLHLFGPNPTILVEGDSSSYFPAMILKPLAPYKSGTVNTYGPTTTSFIGGLHISTPTTYGYSELAAYTTGIKSLSNDSMVVTHQVIGSIGQSADIFDVAANITSTYGTTIAGSLFSVKNSGKLVLSKYKNNVGEDSVLSTDVNGIVKLRSMGSSISSSAWSLTGNTGTNPSTNFLGSTDANRLVFRTKNIERATIDTIGNVGINTTAPAAKLHVAGTGKFTDDVTFEEGGYISATTAGGTMVNLGQGDSTQRLLIGRLDGKSSLINLYGTDVGFGAGNTGGMDNEVNVSKNANASFRVFTNNNIGAYTRRLFLNNGYFDATIADSFTVGVTSGIYRLRNLPITTDTANKIVAFNPTTKELKYMNRVDLVAHTTGILPAANGGTNYTVQSSLSDASGTITWNVANGINGSVTLSGTGRTLSITNPVAGQTYTIRIVQDGSGSRTITTWPTGSKWPSGTTPTLSTVGGRIDIVVFYYDGSNYYGTYQQHFQ